MRYTKLSQKVNQYLEEIIANDETIDWLGKQGRDLKTTVLTEDEKKYFKKLKKSYKPLITWWKKLLGDKVEQIEISRRLTETPCIITTSEYGYTANMERIQKAQAFSHQDKLSASYMYGKKTLEINPNHPSIKELLKKVKEEETPSSDVEDTANLLYDAAAIGSGFSLSDYTDFTKKMDKILKYSLNIDRQEKSSPFEVNLDEEEEKKEEEKEEKNEDGDIHFAKGIDEGEQQKMREEIEKMMQKEKEKKEEEESQTTINNPNEENDDL
jgi:hypothetical protein